MYSVLDNRPGASRMTINAILEAPGDDNIIHPPRSSYPPHLSLFLRRPPSFLRVIQCGLLKPFLSCQKHGPRYL